MNGMCMEHKARPVWLPRLGTAPSRIQDAQTACYPSTLDAVQQALATDGQCTTQVFEHFLSSSLFNSLVECRLNMIHTSTMYFVFRERNLLSHLKCMSQYFLMQDSVFAESLCDFVLRVNATMHTAPRTPTALGILVGSLRDMNNGLDVAINASWGDVHADGLDTEDLRHRLSFLSPEVSTRSAEEGAPSHWFFIPKLHYTVDRELESILTPATMDMYNLIFAFLLELKMARQRLYQSFHCFLSSQRLSQAKTSFGHISKTYWEMHQFLTAWTVHMHYNAVDAVWTDWIRFCDSIHQRVSSEAFEQDLELMNAGKQTAMTMPTLRALERRHDQTLHRMLEAALLDPSSANRMKTFRRALDIVSLFCNELDRGLEDEVPCKATVLGIGQDFSQARQDADPHWKDMTNLAQHHPGSDVAVAGPLRLPVN
jgi:hypothetical protein